ncbi:hypothetical protein [Leptolyngbya sp. CCY15150]|uniref:hypothetical protein n=1 Tax=Leptolyngbya sp. CCY15150 TaxID=2767772 RepID=UPI0019522FD8|nr:hypothetical protein [Leptolyngbya sp. CCY15150]
MKIAHIINPFKAKETQDLFLAQPITFKTMETAQRFAKDYGLEVELYAAYYPVDEEVVPSSFIKTPPLDRSVLDVAKIQFQVPRTFPLLGDILDRLYAATDADYLVYTNVDIALMPFFYTTIARFIERGFDGFAITRRTISKDYKGVDDIPLMYAEYGENHPGHDCFVFNRDVYSQYRLLDACIGALSIGQILLFNIICNAKRFRVFRGHHLTFHLGNDRVDLSETSDEYSKYQDYSDHNLYQVRQFVEYYRSIDKLANHRIIQNFLDSERATMPIPGMEFISDELL